MIELKKEGFQLKKKTLTLVLLSVFLFTVMTQSFSAASTVKVANEVTYTRGYYLSTKDNAQSFYENLAFATTGIFLYTEFEPYHTLSESAEDIACEFITQISMDRYEDITDPQILISKQTDDGSFETLRGTALSVVAISALKNKVEGIMYHESKAVSFILSNQKDDGSFGNGIEDTWIVLSAISQFSADPDVKKAEEKAVDYIRSITNKDGSIGSGTLIEACFAALAITEASDVIDMMDQEWSSLASYIVSFKNKDASYRNHLGDEENCDREATGIALLALDSINRGKSPVKRIIAEGELNMYNPEDYTAFIIFYACVLAVAIGLWIFIFLRKNSTKTLAEAKKERGE